MVSPYDLKVILTREILVLRIMNPNNKYGITPEYLMYALSHTLTNEQSQNKIFIDTTLPNIASRWQEIYIPLYRDKNKMTIIKQKIEEVVKNQWKSLKQIDDMKKNFDVYNT